ASDDPEILAEQGGGEAFHELRRLPKLDLKHDREIAIAAKTVEVDAREGAELLDGVLERRDAGAAVGNRFAHGPLEDGDEQVVLAAEIQIDRAGGDACGSGDIRHLSVEEPPRGEYIRRRAQDRRPLVHE